MPTLAFNSLINQLDDADLALYIKEIGRQNSLSMLVTLISNEDLKTAQHVLLSSVDFNDAIGGSDYWKKIFNRLQP